MPAITFSGVASGIDTGSIIDQIIAARSRPIVNLEARIDTATQRRDSINSLQSTLSNLLTHTQKLTNVATLNARSTSVSKSATGDKTVVSVSADSTAAVGSFQVSVEQLASVTQAESPSALGQAIVVGAALNSAGFATTITDGTFTVNGTQITIDASTVLSDGVDDGASNSILGKINNAGVGVTASIVNDGGGNPNLLQMTSGSAITLGAGGDTSNFLEAAHVLASPGSTTRTSTQSLGQANASVNLVDARLATALSPATGSFTVNGVAISYDSANESLNAIIGKINSSTAGVTANYDSVNDTLELTADATGSLSIALADVTGNFLVATGVLSATQTLGHNASYKINNGPTQYSTSNTIANAVPGMTLTLLEAAAGDNATVTISDDVNSVVSTVQGFVEQYNSTMALIDQATELMLEGESGPLASDSALRLLRDSLRSTVIGLADNLTSQYTSLSVLGFSFGAVGAEVGTTDTLTVDEGILRDAIELDRNAVVEAFAALSVSTNFVANTGSIASATGTPDKVEAGTYRITDDGAGNLTLQFTPADGGGVVISSGTITASGTNTILIPGMTLTAQGTLQAGYDEIVVTRDKAGVAVKLQDLVEQHTKSGGVLEAKTDTIDNLIEDYNDRIAVLEGRLETRRLRLEAKFAAMELVFARFQAQAGTLQALSSTITSST